MANDDQLDDQLDGQLHRMAKRSQERRASAVDTDTALQEHRGRLQAPRGSDGRPRRWLAAAAAVFVVVAGIVAIGWPRGDDPGMVTTQTGASSPSSSTAPDASQLSDTTVVSETVVSDTTVLVAPPTSVPPVAGPWSRTIPEPPLADRVQELVVAMSDSIFVWGGFVPEHADGSVPPFTDGAIVDLATGTWRSIAEGPPADGWASGVWTGSDVVVADRGSVAAYDPVLDTWRDLDAPVVLPTESTPYATHHLTLVDREVVAPFAGLVWDIDQDIWRTIDPAPSLLGYPVSAVIDGRLIVAGAPAESPTNPMVFAYDFESDDWQVLPAPGWQVYEGDAIGFVGERLVVVSSLMGTAGALDLGSLEWRALPTFPQAAKCLGELEPVDETQFVVSLCSLHAALTFGDDEWVLFDPPSTSRTFGLLATGDGLLVDGSLLDPTSADWVRSPLIGPLTIAGVTVDRNVEPTAVAPGRRGGSRVDLAAIDCTLDVSHGDHLDQRTVADAQRDGATAADQVTFFNQFGTYRLSCPDPGAYAAAFDAMIIRGERGTAREMDGLSDPPLPAAPTPEAMVEAVVRAVQADEARLGRESAIGTVAPLGDPPTFLVDIYYDEGAVQGETYTITLHESADGWNIVNATVRSICTRTPRTDTPATCP